MKTFIIDTVQKCAGLPQLHLPDHYNYSPADSGSRHHLPHTSDAEKKVKQKSIKVDSKRTAFKSA